MTDAMLAHVPIGEWLTWRRGHDATDFSPLTAINRDNVRKLRSAWTWSLPNGPHEATPLFHHGVLFVDGYGDKVQALDAATGDLLWQYSRRLPRGVAPTVKHAIALYNDLQKARISPDAAFSVLDWTAYIIFIVVIGGIGTLEGPIIGVIIFYLMQTYLAGFGSWYLIVLGTLAIATMLLAPKGIWGHFSHRVGVVLFPVQRRVAPNDTARAARSAIR